MATISADILIIGAGSGGLSVAAGAAQLGAKTVLLEKGEMGGDCLNYGCVPSKALIAAGKAAMAHRKAQSLNIGEAEPPRIDYAAAMAHVHAAIAAIAPHDSQERFEGFGVQVIRQAGRFTGPNTVQAGEHSITARRVVIATGSAPLVPPIPGLDGLPYMTNETLWQRQTRPERLIVLGGGPIGVEMAQAHARLGSEVVLVEGMDRILAREDADAAAAVSAALQADGVEIATAAKIIQAEGGDGVLRLIAEDGRVFEGSDLLVAVGRKPNLDGLDLDKAGVARSKTGVQVDASLRSTTNRKVYAIGDAAGGLQFTHVAGYHAGQVVRSALFGLPAKARNTHIPRVTYSDPELAHIGLSEAEARAKYGDTLEVICQPFSGNDRAVATGQKAGFLKLYVAKGRPVGVTILHDQAGELIAFWSLAIAAKLKLSAISGSVLPYPTLSEIHKRAASGYFSPRLFENNTVKRVIRLVQKWVP